VATTPYWRHDAPLLPFLIRAPSESQSPVLSAVNRVSKCIRSTSSFNVFDDRQTAAESRPHCNSETLRFFFFYPSFVALFYLCFPFLLASAPLYPMPAEATKSARAVLPRRMLPSLLPPTHTTGLGASHVSQRGNGPPRHRQPHTLSLCPTGNLIPVIRRAPAPLLHPSLPFDDLMARVPWAQPRGCLSSVTVARVASYEFRAFGCPSVVGGSSGMTLFPGAGPGQSPGVADDVISVARNLGYQAPNGGRGRTT
jgi:hypothetical protein